MNLRKLKLLFTFLMAYSLLQMPISVVISASPEIGPTLDPGTIPKYVNQLVIPPVYDPTVVTDPETDEVLSHDYLIDMTQFQEQILPAPLPETTVWGYGGVAKDAVTGSPLGYVRNAPGATFEAVRGIPINVKWQNKITQPHMFAVDPTIHWADPNGMGMTMPPFPAFPPGDPMAQSPVPSVPHLHGGEVQSYYDGHPEAWFTWNGVNGAEYNTYVPTESGSTVFHYPNMQPPTTLWYHDHALGITRINVMSGLAGFYLLRDPADPVAAVLPAGEYEVPLVIQDRSFNLDGSFWFPTEGINPDQHPYWNPEFFGNTIMVNGVVWPNLNVDRGQYRFRVLDGSNARFYTLSFSNNMPFTVIGSDGGYLQAPATLNSLTIAPGERADILVDFSGLAPGTNLILQNGANAPFPDGDTPDPMTTGQVMQFTVGDDTGAAPAALPTTMNPTLPTTLTFPTLTSNAPPRVLTLYEMMGANGPLMILLNGQPWHAAITELPRLGSTEDWIIVNLTMDAHPIHLHLTQFQLVSRQAFLAGDYATDWVNLNGMPPFMMKPTVLQPDAYLLSVPSGPRPNEVGWKDTVQVNPGEVTTIRVRFSPIDGTPSYPFDATAGPGYVWHCHILDHEDNAMMRPYMVVAPVGGTILDWTAPEVAALGVPTPGGAPPGGIIDANLCLTLSVLIVLASTLFVVLRKRG